jgi:5-methylcytosine-specific restriction endonuclease McrA
MICGVTFTRSAKHTSMCCSSECTVEAKRERYRRKNRARRTKKAPGAYTRTQVAERDGRRCHLCGGRVDMALSGMDPAGPTIDHLLPLSVGGLDELANVALAHRACNIRKGNRGDFQQLRLVG